MNAPTEEREVVNAEDVRARQIARQAEATEQLADAVEVQNDLLRHLVDAIHHGGQR